MWLNALFLKYRTIFAAGLPMPKRAGTNYVGASVTDDPENDATVVTVTGGGAPTGAAGGQLGGTYPNPTVNHGTSSSTACAGDDSRLSDSRAPTGAAGGALAGTYPNPTLPVSAAVSAYAIDWSLSGVFTKTLGAGAQVFTFSNAGDGQVITVVVTGAASTLTWPTVKWAGGIAPTQTASGTDVYTFVKAGSTIYGAVVQAMA